jgi:DHA1 family bicyclomycin/chloramphenicol resistance-like MFS transporter
MVPLTGATIDIYVPSLPAITTHFGVPVQLVQWTIPSYLIGYSLAQLFCGALSDVGTKSAPDLGISLYTGASCLAAFSPSIAILIGVRCARIGCGGSRGARARESRATALLPIDYQPLPITSP